MPNNIVQGTGLYSKAASITLNYMHSLRSDGWKFYVVDQRRGYCSYGRKEITIPLWLKTQNKSDSYIRWYIAHEVAHAITSRFVRFSHGDEFVASLKKVCPDADIHHELGYKSRAAKKAHIYDFSEL